ncbi:uncharacterized protein LOC131061840 isoform X5 [Cryptomeria japonica]|uniref:uncharacterized protein LOC131061840 isoform X5 n=1 Tax=Cryptomeria japonica TaxID=3369 RepID=UPI0025AC2DAB|nr:uncharacterized protein LOC131061840 isoform X5 [Cryptomeria japonica]XP_059076024.1 uncharacterized protein LOC131061840 isoform X5 [Cryptomeria japonica]
MVKLWADPQIFFTKLDRKLFLWLLRMDGIGKMERRAGCGRQGKHSMDVWICHAGENEVYPLQPVVILLEKNDSLPPAVPSNQTKRLLNMSIPITKTAYSMDEPAIPHAFVEAVSAMTTIKDGCQDVEMLDQELHYYSTESPQNKEDSEHNFHLPEVCYFPKILKRKRTFDACSPSICCNQILDDFLFNIG